MFFNVAPELWWSPYYQRYVIVVPFPYSAGLPTGVERLPKEVRGIPLIPMTMPPGAIDGRGATLTDGLGRFMSQKGTDAFGGQVITVSGRVVRGRRPVVRAVGCGGSSCPAPQWPQPPATLLSCYPEPQLVGSFHSMQPLVTGYDPLHRQCRMQ